MQVGHEGNELALLAFCDGDKLAQGVGGVFDISVGEPEVARAPGMEHALGDGPELAGPTLGERFAAQNLKPGCVQALRNLPGPIITVIIDQHNPELARIVLCDHTPQRAGNDIRLVTRRNHRDDIRPSLRLGQADTVIPLTAEPEARGEERQPDRQRQAAQHNHRIIPCLADQSSASFNASG
jgi:hypothetical protein